MLLLWKVFQGTMLVYSARKEKQLFQVLIQPNYNYWGYPEGLPCTFMNLLKQVAQLSCNIFQYQNVAKL